MKGMKKRVRESSLRMHFLLVRFGMALFSLFDIILEVIVHSEVLRDYEHVFADFREACLFLWCVAGACKWCLGFCAFGPSRCVAESGGQWVDILCRKFIYTVSTLVDLVKCILNLQWRCCFRKATLVNCFPSITIVAQVLIPCRPCSKPWEQHSRWALKATTSAIRMR